MKHKTSWLFSALLVSVSLLQIEVWAESKTGADNVEQSAEIELIRQQALKGEPGGQLLYGLALMEGRYQLKPDVSQGLTWIRRAAEGGDARAALVLGNACAQGKGTKQDPAEALKWWHKAANKDISEAQYQLGKAYMEGLGVPKDPQKAGSWLKQAADAGSADAQYLLGRMHHEGVVVEQNQDSALHWLRRAANNGHQEAVHLLGLIESLVKALSPLREEGYEALHRRALEHDPHAQYELALRYESGAFDVNTDLAKALSWFNKAAENGNVLAMHRLARAWENGELGLPKDPSKAAYWQEKGRLHQLTADR